MPRPRSADRRQAILAAATDVIAAQGLGAATAAIAKAAGVSNGSLFGYFDTKATLMNELYVELKTEMGASAMAGLPATGEPRGQMHHLWNHWLAWATSYPNKRRALAQLDVSDEITVESHQIARTGFGGMAELLDRSRVNGPLKDASLGLVLTLTTALAEATIDSMINDPENAETTSEIAFDAMWRMLA